MGVETHRQTGVARSRSWKMVVGVGVGGDGGWVWWVGVREGGM